jgi:hypothetical protein
MSATSNENFEASFTQTNFEQVTSVVMSEFRFKKSDGEWHSNVLSRATARNQIGFSQGPEEIGTDEPYSSSPKNGRKSGFESCCAALVKPSNILINWVALCNDSDEFRYRLFSFS